MSALLGVVGAVFVVMVVLAVRMVADSVVVVVEGAALSLPMSVHTGVLW